MGLLGFVGYTAAPQGCGVAAELRAGPRMWLAVCSENSLGQLWGQSSGPPVRGGSRLQGPVVHGEPLGLPW